MKKQSIKTAEITEDDVNIDVCEMIQDRMKISNAEFWRRIGVSQPSGHNIMKGNSRLLRVYRRLIYMEYIAGIKTDGSTPESAGYLMRVGAAISNLKANGKL